MSVAVDANVLLYADNEADPLHEPARELLRRLSAGPDLVFLFWPVLMAYLRIATQPRAFPRPLPVAEAMANVARLTGASGVRSPGEAPGFWAVYETIAGAVAPRGNLVPDAHIAALMHQHGVGTIYTRDRDFRKFDGIRAIDPFA